MRKRREKKITRLEGRCVKAGLVKAEEEGGRGAPEASAGSIGGGVAGVPGVPGAAGRPGRPGSDVRESTVITVLPDSSFVFIDKFNGASSGLDVDDVDDVDGFPIRELTSSASGFPFTV